MSFGVLTILLGLVILLVPKLIPAKRRESAEPDESDLDSASKTEQNPINNDSPEKLAKWVLKNEIVKTELKEKLCQEPSFSEAKILYGREEVIIELFHAINKGRTFLELYGRQGIGKTALALDIVRKYKYNFQNVKLFLDFGGEGEDALSTRDAMIQIVLRFRPTVRIPESMAQLKKLYQQLMAKRQGILVLDNISSASQVKEMKPAGENFWMIIVTTEKQLNIKEAYSFHVEPIDIESAEEFLTQCSLRLKPRAREIAKLCRGIPLALQICGHFMSAKMKVSPEDFVEMFRKHRNSSFLERQDEHAESMMAAFKVIFYLLSDKEQKVFNQLSVFPATFDFTAGAQISEENGNCLNFLSQAGLVRTDLITKRYSLHDWVRNQLSDYIPETLTREARLRHAEYYLPVFKTARENISEGGKIARDGFQLFHREWTNLRTGLDRVRKNSVEGKKAAELFNLFIVEAAELLPLRYFPKDCRSFLETGIKVAKRLNTENIEAQHLLNLGIFHLSQHKLEAADECLQKAYQLTTKLNDAKTGGKVLNEIARLQLVKERHDEAITTLLHKNKLCWDNKIEVDEETSLLRLGMAYEKKGEFEKAIQALEEGKNKAKEKNNGICLGSLLKHLGFCLGKFGQLSNSEDYLEASLKLARGMGKRKDELEILLQLGKTHARTQEMQQALSLLEEGLELAEKYRDKKHEGMFLVQMGDIFNRKNEKQKSVEYYIRALKPLKNAKELKLVDEINKRLNQPFETANDTKDNDKSIESDRVIKPVLKLSQSKGMGLVQAKTSEFINRGDKKLLTYYVGSVEEIIKTYNLDTNEPSTRDSFLELMTALRKNNHHACATILKNKLSL